MLDLGRWSKSVFPGEGGHWVESMTAEIGNGYVHHSCSTNDVMKNQEK